MSADLLARIAKALEDGPKCAFSGLPQGRCSHCGGDGTMLDGTRALLGECQAALQLAVEALQAIAENEVSPVSAHRAREALSRLAPAAEEIAKDECVEIAPIPISPNITGSTYQCETCHDVATQWDYDQMIYFCDRHIQQADFTVPIEDARHADGQPSGEGK